MHVTRRIDQALDLDAIDIISADGEEEDETTAEANEQETPEVTIYCRKPSLGPDSGSPCTLEL